MEQSLKLEMTKGQQQLKYIISFRCHQEYDTPQELD